jgi:hypothetical protein
VAAGEVTVRAFVIFASTFLVGAVLMGFEMLGSRYLYPYFGGGIGTWAALISTVLYALTIGYFAGGTIVDRLPSPRVIAVAALLAAAYMACIPATADTVMSAILTGWGGGLWPTLFASAALLLVPIALLGTMSPVAVRLLLTARSDAGRVAGFVYGISTIGSVFGTLFTTFTLIPAIGSRAITYCFAAVLVACGLALLGLRRPGEP